MNSRELLQQALTALIKVEHVEGYHYFDKQLLEAIREHLEKEPEPHSWVRKTKAEMEIDNRSFMQPLYTKDDL